MSTPDQSDNPQLTRKQMREQQRVTGSIPIVTPAAAPAGTQAVGLPPVPPLPRPAEQREVAPAVPDSSVDLGVSPLTRRQARQQERIRTASVPVITPEVAAAHHAATTAAAVASPPAAATAAAAAAAAAAPLMPAYSPPLTVPPAHHSEPEPMTAASSLRSLFDSTDESPVAPVRQAQTPSLPPLAMPSASVAPAAPKDDDFATAMSGLGINKAEPAQTTPQERPTVGAAFGAALGTAPAAPARTEDGSFENALGRDTSTNGSVASPHALIVSQNPTAGPISAPISGTGEMLVTGTYALPDGLGSLGHVPGAADGKEVDATLVDGELPVHSSPTPIAASSAVSTVVKGQEELIRPPAPEKGSKLMMTLAIIAGGLAVCLVAVLGVAIATGVFSQ